MEEKVRFVNDRGHEDVQKCKGPALPRVRVAVDQGNTITPAEETGGFAWGRFLKCAPKGN